MSNGNYIVIRDWMITELGLKGVPKDVYAIVYAFSKDGKGVFNAGIKWLADLLQVDRSTVKRAIAKLLKAELITRQDCNSSTGGTNIYTVNFDKIPKEATKNVTVEEISEYEKEENNEEQGKSSEGGAELHHGVAQNALRGGAELHHGVAQNCTTEVNNNININKNIKSVSIVNSCMSVDGEDDDTDERKVSSDNDNFDNSAYLDFIRTYDVVIDGYNSEILNMDFVQIKSAYANSRKFLQARPYCKFLSWICRNYKRIINRYYEDYDTTPAYKIYSAEEKAQLKLLYADDETVPY